MLSRTLPFALGALACAGEPDWAPSSLRGSLVTAGGPQECKDHDWSCIAWSNAGRCQSDPAFMMKTCYKACARCTEAPSACADHDWNCISMAQAGQCLTSPGMIQKCRKACGACTPGGSDLASTSLLGSVSAEQNQTAAAPASSMNATGPGPNTTAPGGAMAEMAVTAGEEAALEWPGWGGSGWSNGGAGGGWQQPPSNGGGGWNTGGAGGGWQQPPSNGGGGGNTGGAGGGWQQPPSNGGGGWNNGGARGGNGGGRQDSCVQDAQLCSASKPCCALGYWGGPMQCYHKNGNVNVCMKVGNCHPGAEWSCNIVGPR